MKILALDPAEICGWAIDKNLYGIWNLKIKRDESSGMKLVKFKAKINEICNLMNIELIVFERPGGRFKNDIISHAKFQAIIEDYCLSNNIQYKGYSSKEIKKFASGKGNANKNEMVEAAKKKFNYEGEDHNEADAICLLNLAISEFKDL